MKYFIRGLSRNSSVVTREPLDELVDSKNESNKESIKDKSYIIIGPTCIQCVLSVRDMDDIAHCVRYSSDICKYDSENFGNEEKEFRKLHKCKCGKYILTL